MGKLGLTMFLAILGGAVGFVSACDDDGGNGSSSSSSGSSGTPSGFCARGCDTVDDCCGGIPGCPGDYPNNLTCAPDGYCQAGQCSSNEECTMGGVLPDYECFGIDTGTMGTFHLCAEPCSTDTDCTAQDATCSGDTVSDDNVFCTSEVTTNTGCTNDSQCPGLGTCDTTFGVCTCTESSECTAAGVDTCITI